MCVMENSIMNLCFENVMAGTLATISETDRR